MKKFLLTLIAIFFTQINVFSEEMHFDNEKYTLKFSALAQNTQGYGNEYFRNSEDVANWNKMIGIYSYPNIENPLEFASDFDKTAENTDNSLVLKLIENKKTNKAIISLLVNGSHNSKKYFEYDVYKFEKQKPKGMIVSKYAAKYYFTNNDDINKIASNIKKNNDKYLELFAISQTPAIIERDIFPTNN